MSQASILPAFFDEALKASYSAADVERIAAGLAQRRATTLRANAMLTTRGEIAAALDAALRRLNSDYDAKRAGKFFLDAPEIISLKSGVFRHWLESVGNQKLGGQRKVPRLSNDRAIADHVLAINAAL